jgi:hypothetical protein
MIPRPPHWLTAAALGLLLLTSCKSGKEANEDPLALPGEEEEIAYIPTYSKSVLAGWPKGRALDPTDVSRVRLGEQVHAYHVGRLPSHDRQEMHEAHTVYRLEQNAKWDTRLPATPMDSRGVVLGVIDPARNEVPKTTLIEQERQSLLAKSRQLELTMTRLTSLQADLEKRRAKFDEAQQTNATLQQELQANLQARSAAEESLKQAKARIEELEDAERFRLKTSSQGLIVPKKK